MITKEQLEATSLKASLQKFFDGCRATRSKEEADQILAVRRPPESVFGTVISAEQVDEFFARPESQEKRDHLLYSHLCTIGDDKVFFFTDDSNYGHTILPKAFIGAIFSGGLPRSTGQGTPILTVADFVGVYHKGERQLNTVDELVEYLNTTYYAHHQ